MCGIIMGDVNFLMHSQLKIKVLREELDVLEMYCEIIKEELNEYEHEEDDEYNGLILLSELYDKRLFCLKRLKRLMISRFNFLSNQ